MADSPAPRRRIVLVSGLSGAGKASILHALEDLGFEAMDNPPLSFVAALVGRSDRPLAIGVDARSRGFDPTGVLTALAELRANPALAPMLVFAEADEGVLLGRYTESRRRHPLAPMGTVAEGIAAERTLTLPLRNAADLCIDTSETTLAELRRLIGGHFGAGTLGELALALVSFAYPRGLPREADLVFDVRFLRNPHYVAGLAPLTGLAREVGAFIESDPDFAAFFTKLEELLRLLLPRYRQEGKSYATIAVGCTGGRHRSVYVVEQLGKVLVDAGWRVQITHRELARGPQAGGTGSSAWGPRRQRIRVMTDRTRP